MNPLNLKINRIFICLLSFFLLFFLASGPALAKKNKTKNDHTNTVNPRLQNMTTEDKDLFNELTKKQQNMIRESKIEEGFNAWMVKLALGEPYYNTEHHPVYVNYEQVWLYTKDQVDETKTENQILDPVTNWPSVHRYKKKKTCTVGDFFILFDRGVVDKIIGDDSKKIYGSCHIETQEEFLPIVNGKVVENPK